MCSSAPSLANPFIQRCSRPFRFAPLECKLLGKRWAWPVDNGIKLGDGQRLFGNGPIKLTDFINQ